MYIKSLLQIYVKFEYIEKLSDVGKCQNSYI